VKIGAVQTAFKTQFRAQLAGGQVTFPPGSKPNWFLWHSKPGKKGKKVSLDTCESVHARVHAVLKALGVKFSSVKVKPDRDRSRPRICWQRPAEGGEGVREVPNGGSRRRDLLFQLRKQAG
jgi:hypothetical protein